MRRLLRSLVPVRVEAAYKIDYNNDNNNNNNNGQRYVQPDGSLQQVTP